ncbi:MAG: nitroreductase family protein [Ferruginibacter sp.]
MNQIKRAITKYPVLDIIKNRWSPRSFSTKAISDESMQTILEAATWSFSSMNEQPWRFVVAQRGTDLFNSFHDTLFPGNQPWNKNAAAFILSIKKKNIGDTEKPNGIALHDVGAANMLLTLQANSMGIYTHLIGGFAKDKVAEMLKLDETLEPVVLIALGYPDDAEKLDEPFKSREIEPRKRIAVDELILAKN